MNNYLQYSEDELLDLLREHLSERRGAPLAEAKMLMDGNIEFPSAGIGDIDVYLPQKQEYSLREFNDCTDREFVDNAYRALLGREPDPEGKSHYLKQLSDGRFDRIDVLARLRFSGEGRAAKVRCRWLMPCFIAATLSRVPLLGFVFWLVPNLFSMDTKKASRQKRSALERRMERMEEAVNTCCHESLRYARETSSRDKAWKDQLERRVGTLSEAENKVDLANYKVLQLECKKLAISYEQLREQIDSYHFRMGKVESRSNELKGIIDSTDGKLLGVTTDVRSLKALEAEFGDLIEHHRRLVEAAKEKTASRADMYVQYENRFRGSREDILGRAKDYLPYLERFKEKSVHYPVVDAGCGRGELVEVLRQAGINAHGFDSNPAMIEFCLGLGLPVEKKDLFRFLADAKDESIAALCSIHVVEHLSPQELLYMLERAQDVLIPGGGLVLETPNPENVLMGGSMFYRDFTHIRPVHPEALEELAASVGFRNSEILRLRTMEEVFSMEKTGASLDEWTLGALDYALVAYKEGSL